MGKKTPDSEKKAAPFVEGPNSNDVYPGAAKGDDAAGAGGNYDQMKKAYQASANLIKDELQATKKEDLATLEQISEADVLVVPGTYDRIQDVLSLVGIKFKVVEARSFDRIELHPSQTVFINCPGTGFSDAGLDRIKYFVRDGGLLVTTDWALRNVIERAFPGTIAYNERSTTDDVVKIKVIDASHPYLQGLMTSGDAEPLWWLESSSYPIKILAPGKVKVLVTSSEMERKYGESTIVCTFARGKGEVLHLTSHYYLQRTETRGKGKDAKAADFVKSKAFAAKTALDSESAAYSAVGFKAMESAYTSQKFVANVVIQQKKKWLESQKQGNAGGGKEGPQPKE
jgi:hypothetical protein